MKLFFLPIYFEFQSTLYTVKSSIVQWGFLLMKMLYQPFQTDKPWNIQSKALLQLDKNTLGFHTGCFLLQNSFELQPACEDHDVFHVITGAGISSVEEIAMQFWLLGNGKHSFPTIMATAAGAFIFPEKWSSFYRSCRNGASSNPIHDLNHRLLLGMPLKELRNHLKIKTIHN